MNSERIKMLEQFVADDPKDPFNHYALALELMKFDKEKARKIFDSLIIEHPTYVATYYQAAMFYLALSMNDKATRIIEQGIVEAKKQNNMKAASELRSLMDELD